MFEGDFSFQRSNFFQVNILLKILRHSQCFGANWNINLQDVKIVYSDKE